MTFFKSPTALWADIAIVCLGMWGVALLYQYGFGHDPCVLCIHARLWISMILGISLLAIVLNSQPWAQLVLWVGLLGSSFGLLERSFVLVGTERGWIVGSCSFDLNPGLPEWLPLHNWLPELFRPLTTCGLTPELMFGISMADGLVFMSGILFVIAFIAVFAMGASLLKGEDLTTAHNWGKSSK